MQFQKIFVVSMPYRTDRRDAMSLAAAFSNLEVEYADGIAVAEENFDAMKKLLPPGGYGQDWKVSGLGAWRAHMNVIRKSVCSAPLVASPTSRSSLANSTRRIVEQNLTSALIMEDDVDWDIRIKVSGRMLSDRRVVVWTPLTVGSRKCETLRERRRCLYSLWLAPRTASSTLPTPALLGAKRRPISI